MMHVRGRPELRGWTALAATLVLLSACKTTIRQHPEFQSRIAHISEVGIMPPEISIVSIVFKGDNERLPEREQSVARNLPRLLVRYLGEHDFTVRVVPLDDEMLTAVPELRFETSQSHQSFANAMSEMYETEDMWKSDAENYERSLGPVVNQFAELADVDALLFSRYSGFTKSGGELVKDIVVAAILGATTFATLAEGATLQVSLVDGDTGDLLWTNLVRSTDSAASFSNLFKPLSPIEILVKGAFKKFKRGVDNAD